MKASHQPLYEYTPPSVRAPRMRQAPSPQFGSFAEAAARIVGMVDSSRQLELITTDGMGMILPRTTMALHMRGVDDGRETFIRESTGLIGNALLVGMLSWGMLRLFGRKLNPLNPQGIPGQAWINAQNLDSFESLYKEALTANSTQHEGDARQRFIRRVLSGLESGDKQFSLPARLAGIEKLDLAQQPEALRQLLGLMHGEHASKQMLTTLQAQHLQPEALIARLRETLEKEGNARWGKLSQEATEQLARYYEPTQGGKTVGTRPFEQLAQHNLETKRQTFIQSHELGAYQNTMSPAAYEQLLKKKGFDADKVRMQERLLLAQQDLQYEESKFVQAVDDFARRKGLTSTLHLRQGEAVTQSHSRPLMLKELKYFLEQYVDRAQAEVSRQPGYAKGDWQTRRALLQERLFDARDKQGWFRFLPGSQDALVAATRKSKVLYTWIPLTLTLLAAGVFTFYNNYITMKKHGGKVFFPGEGLPPIEGGQALPGVGSPSATPSPMRLMDAARYRNFGNFPNYPQFRNASGGIIA